MAADIINVTSSTNDGIYGIDDTISIEVEFSEPVIVNEELGTPHLTLNTNGIAKYSTGSGSETLTFDYIPQSGHVSTSDLAYILEAPSLTGNYNISGSNFTRAYDVAVSGKHAYVAAFDLGLRIVDVSNPSSPTLAKAFNYNPWNNNALGVDVNGDYAYVADGNFGIRIIDVKTPSSPALVATYDTPMCQGCYNGTYHEVTVRGNYAYAATGVKGLEIINVSKPSSPTLVGSSTVPGPNAPFCCPGQAVDVAVSGNYAYVVSDGGLAIVDISKKSSPTVVGSFSTPSAYGVTVRGSHAYIADNSQGLRIIDVSNPSSPSAAGVYSTPGAHDVVVSGDYAYVANGTKGLRIVDVSNPLLPTAAGTYNTDELGIWDTNALGVTVSGNYAYVANGTRGLRIVERGRIDLNSGTINDSNGNTANLVLPPSGTSASLSFNKNIEIDIVEDPTAIELTSAVTSLPEDADTTSAVKMGGIVITDPDSGSFTDNFNANPYVNTRWSTFDEASATSSGPSSWNFDNDRIEQTSNIYGTISNGEGALWGTIHYVDNPSLNHETTDVRSRVYSGDNDDIGLVSHYSRGTGSHYRLSIRQQVGKAYLWRVDNSNNTAVLLNSVSATYTKNEWFDMQLVVEGNQLTGYKDGMPIITAVDNTAGGPLRAGTGGLFAGGNAPSYFDDFEAVVPAGNGNDVTLSGADADLFEVVDSELRLKAGVALDYETKSSYAVTLTTGSVSVDHTLTIIDVNDAPVGTVTISGVATEGEILTASNDLADEDGLGSVWNSSSWGSVTMPLNDCTTRDLGTTLTVSRATTTIKAFTSATSSAYVYLRDEADQNQGRVAYHVSNHATVVKSVDFDPPITVNAIKACSWWNSAKLEHLELQTRSISYHWNRDAVSIAGATGDTYTLVPDDVGSVITVTASYTDHNGTDESVISDATGIVTALPPVITLVGDANMTLEASRNGQYMDLGATCTSNVDGNLNHAVVVSGQIVNMRVPGTYTIQYNCTDLAGQSAQPAIRNVEVQDTLPPVITLSLEDIVIHIGDNTQTGLGGENNVHESQPQSTSENAVGNAFRLTNPVYREHDLSYTQPDGSAVKSRQDWTLKSAANSVEVLLPTATAWDRVDDSVEVAMTIRLIDLDGDGQTSVQSQVDLTRRSTYLFKYDVQDDSGNHAEQVVFALILNDLEEPSISLAGGPSQVIQAGSDWELGQSTAHDNIDGDLTDQVRYAVHDTATQAELGSDLSYADAAALVDTMTLGEFLVTVVVSDAAGIYGANSVNNTAQKQQAVQVRDTLAPVITLIGDAKLTLEATREGDYVDAGATAYDTFDGEISGDIHVSGAVVDLAKIDVYEIHYDVTDASGNLAATVIRTITVADTLAPVITALSALELDEGDSVHMTGPDLAAYASDQYALPSDLEFRIVNVSDIASEFGVTIGMDSSSGNFASRTDTTLHVHPSSDFNGTTTVTIGARDSSGNVSNVQSFVLTIRPVNDLPTGTVTITGTAQEDETLTAAHNLADEDGLGPISHQWYRDGVVINGAATFTYTLTHHDVGTNITLAASYTDGHGTAESVTSDPTGIVHSNITSQLTGHLVHPVVAVIVETQAVDLAGFTFVAPDILVETGGTLTGYGSVSAPVSGSGTIELVGGNMSLGDLNNPSGFDFDGTLNLNGHTAVLQDSDAAVLGTTTQLGSGGTLIATNDLALGEGRRINGTGEIISRTLDHQGSIYVIGGSLIIRGNLSGDGDFPEDGQVVILGDYQPGNSPAVIEFGGDLDFGANAHLVLEINGAEPGSGYDQLNIAGQLTAGGTLEIVLVDGYNLEVGQSFNLLDFNSVSGEFSQVLFTGQPLAAGQQWNDSLLNRDGIVSVQTTIVIPNPKSAEWDGNAAVGHVGDGASWSDANNWSWTEGGIQDLPPNDQSPGDDVVFPSSPTVGTIDLESSRTVNSLSFAAGYTLANHTLTVTSGNIAVDAGVAATIRSDISGPTGITKTGPGTLAITGAADAVKISAGTLVLGSSATMNDLSIGSGTLAILNGSVMGDIVNRGTLMVIGDEVLAGGGAVSLASAAEEADAFFNQDGAGAPQAEVVVITPQGHWLQLAAAGVGNGEQPSAASIAVLESTSDPIPELNPDYREVVNYLFDELGRDDEFEFGSKRARSQVDQQDALLGSL